MAVRMFRSVRDVDPVRADYIVKPDVAARTVWPRWDVQAPDVQNVFRLLPVINPETGEIQPFRWSGEPRDFGPWLLPCYIASISGQNGLSFIAADVREYDTTDVRSTPYFVLYDSVSEAIQCNAKPEWVSYNLVSSPSGGNTVPLLLPPERRYLAMCFIASHYDYPLRDRLYGAEPGEPLFILVMTRTAGIRLMDQLDAGTDAQALDILNPAGGAFVRIYPSTNPTQRGYDVAILQQYGKVTPVLPPSAMRKLCWWDDVLYFPTPKEQMELLCKSTIPADVLLYAFKGTAYEEYLPERVLAAGSTPMASVTLPWESAPAVTQTDIPPVSPATQTPGIGAPTGVEIPEEYRKALAEAEARRRKQS